MLRDNCLLAGGFGDESVEIYSARETTSIEIGVPNKFDVSQNYPNPFNPTTKINFDLPADSKVTLVIYDVTGRQVTKLLNNELHLKKQN
jgi:hypothetical protein